MSHQATNWRKWIWAIGMGRAGNALTYLHEIEAAQWWPREKVQQQQSVRLTHLLQFAYKHVPYYRSLLVEHGLAALFDASPTNGSVASEALLAQFAQLPCLDKGIVRQHSAHLVADDLATRRWWHDATGGSTGEPMRFIVEQPYHEWRQAVRHLFDAWTGYRVGEPRLVLWGATRDHATWRKAWRTHLLPYVIRWLKQEHWVNTFRLTSPELQACVAYMQNVRPQHILAYAESVYEVALWIENRGLRVPPVRAVMTSASTLFPHMRAVIERVFAAPVFDRYGSREMGDVACECEQHAGLHISPLTHYVEILDVDGKAVTGEETGEIVVTAFANCAMPLIRYRTGDYGRWAVGECACGRSWPRLAAVEGRVQDTLLAANGDWISSAAINKLFCSEAWIHRYQVVQVALDHLEVYLQLAVSSLSFDSSSSTIPVTTSATHLSSHLSSNHLSLVHRLQMQKSLQALFGDNCRVEITVVDEIPPTASGKHRPVRSQLRMK